MSVDEKENNQFPVCSLSLNERVIIIIFFTRRHAKCVNQFSPSWPVE